MIINTPKSEITGSFSGTTSKFKIKTSAKTFKILSSNIYQNKVRAIIREISCNAVDGHIALARTGLPTKPQFDIVLPTSLDPRFICRDYGIGLSKESVFDIFTTYFESTKEDSNDEIGALGLGSKSPFCYTDTFSITSWFNGFKYVYTAFIQNGEPMVMLISETQSNEHTGVEISVPVGDDIDIWYREARKVYASFEQYTPNFVGFELVYDKLVFENDICSKNHGSFNRNLYAVMGSVVYPIPDQFINGYLHRFIKHNSVFIKFDIGDLDIMPSREELSLDDHTINNINKKIEYVNKLYMSDIENIIVESSDVRDLYQRLQSYPEFVWGLIADHKLKNDDITIGERRSILTTYTAPHKNQSFYTIDYNSGTLRRKKFKEIYNLISIHQNTIRTTIVNDIPEKTKANEIIKKMFTMDMIKGFPLIFDICDNRWFIDGFGKSVLLGDVNNDKLKSVLSLWPERCLTNVIYLSKVKDDVLAKFKSSGKSVPTAHKYKPVNTTIINENGEVSEKQLYADDIKQLDGYYCCNTIDGYYSYDELNSGKLSQITSSIKLFKSIANYKKINIYLFRKSQLKTASNSKLIPLLPFIRELFDDLLKTSPDKLIYNVKRHDVWLSRLNEDIRTKSVFDKIVGNGLSKTEYQKSELLSVIYTNCYGSTFEDQCKTYNKLVSDNNNINKEKIEKFKSNNMFIYHYLDENWLSSDRNIVNNMIELIKW